VVTPMPTTPSAPLLPLKDPVGTVVDEVEEDVSVNGVDFGVRVERPETVPVPEEVELEEGERVEEEAAPMTNAGVWLSTVFTSPIGEAWNVYPEPGSTTGIVTVTV